MSTIALRFCSQPGCSAFVEHGYCPAHSVQREHLRTNIELRKLYRTVHWRKLRRLVLQDEPLCPECMAEDLLVTPTVDVHHTVKATAENFFDRSILQALCHEHHSRHTKRGE